MTNPLKVSAALTVMSGVCAIAYLILALIAGALPYWIAFGAWTFAAGVHGAVTHQRRKRWISARRTTRRTERAAASLERIDHSLTGWKRAGLVVDGDDVKFRAAVHGLQTYGANATAVCPAFDGLVPGWLIQASGIQRHAAPDKDCSCGFYAARDRGMLPQLAGEYSQTVVDLEVQLSGHYLQFEHGYRAEKQQVMSVRIDRRCHLTIGDFHRSCLTPAETLVVTNSGLVYPMCVPCAAEMSSRGVLSSQHFTLPDIAARLGVHDVRWADTPALNPRKES